MTIALCILGGIVIGVVGAGLYFCYLAFKALNR